MKEELFKSFIEEALNSQQDLMENEKRLQFEIPSELWEASKKVQNEVDKL